MLELFKEQLMNAGFPEYASLILSWTFAIAIITILASLANYIGKKVLLRSLKFFIKKTQFKWDDIFEEHRTFDRFISLLPVIIIYISAPIFVGAEDLIQRVALSLLFFIGLLISYSLVNSLVYIYHTCEISKEKPIKSYFEVIKIALTIVIGIIIIATILNRSPWGLLSGLGAMTAILILVFRDSILGFLASLQLTYLDMVRVGDWVEMPKYGADGNVIDVTLHIVKVQNWDKTITTIPTYKLVSESFKNWRGMEESGGRRIKRSIYIDINSIKFCTPELLSRFEKMQLITDYIKNKKKDIEDHNKNEKIDVSEIINSRNLTNIGTFRAYVKAYLRNHPRINNDMTFLVRQLQPTQHGLPIEIYVFSNVQEWDSYEGIQADIMDHLFASLPEFQLLAYQFPSGRDLSKLTKHLP